MTTGVAWRPICLLPNIEVRGAIGCDIAVVTSAEDARVESIAAYSPALNKLMSSFTDQRGTQVVPSFIMLREDAPSALQTAEAIAAFRDAVCMSLIPLNRAHFFQSPYHGGPAYSDTLDIYPWMASALGNDITAWTNSIVGVLEVDKFRGQSSPGIFHCSAMPSDFDEPLLTALLQRWRARFEATNSPHSDVALFRSLNMAFHAARIPAGPEGTHYDHGRLIALWISACEILAHPGSGKEVNQSVVKDRIQRIPWLKSASGTSQCHPQIGDAALTLVGKLYKRRHDYLHGNSVKSEDLKIGHAQRYVSDFAAQLYRMLLVAFLEIRPSEPVLGSSVDELNSCLLEHLSFDEFQMPFEKCILAAT